MTVDAIEAPEATETGEAIRTFRVNIPESALAHLHRRLSHKRLGANFKAAVVGPKHVVK